MEKPADTGTPIHDLLARRWSPRAFQDRPVPEDAIRAILEAARWSQSSMNEQPWRYIIATRDDTPAFERVLGCLMPGNVVWARNAPVLMLGIAKTQFTRNGNANRTAFHDLGAASANLSIQATALGLAVHQMGGIYPDKAREEFGIPDGFEAVTALAVGYPGEPDMLPDELRQREMEPRTRMPLGDFVYGTEWGVASPLTGREGNET